MSKKNLNTHADRRTMAIIDHSGIAWVIFLFENLKDKKKYKKKVHKQTDHLKVDNAWIIFKKKYNFQQIQTSTMWICNHTNVFLLCTVYVNSSKGYKLDKLIVGRLTDKIMWKLGRNKIRGVYWRSRSRREEVHKRARN